MASLRLCGGLSVIQFSKFLARWVGSSLHMCSWRWAQVFIKRLYEVTFSSSSLSVISPDISHWLMFPFLPPENWGFRFLSLPRASTTGVASRATLWEGREKHTNRACSHPSVTLVPSNEANSSSPSEFCLLQDLTLLVVADMMDCYELRCSRRENGGEIGYFCNLSVHSEFPLRGFPSSLLLLRPGVDCQCVDFRPGRKNDKLIIVCWYFKPGVLLYTAWCYSESLDRCSLHSVHLHSVGDMVFALYYHLAQDWNFAL